VITKTAQLRNQDPHRKVAACGLVLALGTSLVAGLPAQVAAPDPIVAQIVPLLQSASPMLRGEAALALARTRNNRFYTPILALAADKEAATRQRAILALGYLQQPGADILLNRILQKAPRGSLDRSLAAMALGLLPEEPRLPAVDEFFAKVLGSSRKRIHDELSSILVGLLDQPHPTYRSSLLSILEDTSYKNRTVLVLVLENLANISDGIPTGQLFQLLDSNNPRIVQTSLHVLLRSPAKLTNKQINTVVAMASRAKTSPQVRSSALRLLTSRRYPKSIELANAFLKSNDPALVAAAVHTIVSLGGGTLRKNLESRIIKTTDTRMQRIMMKAKTAPHGDEFRKACLNWASDKTIEDSRRIPAALIVATTGQRKIIPTLTDLFLASSDLATMVQLAKALQSLSVDLCSKVYPTKSMEDAALLPNRLQALIAANHKQAGGVLVHILTTKTVPKSTQADAIRAYRLGHSSTLNNHLTDLAPAGVQAFLR
jgi:HEAT repeat protein